MVFHEKYKIHFRAVAQDANQIKLEKCFGKLNEAEGMQKLNSYLADKSYINGTGLVNLKSKSTVLALFSEHLFL